jgi:uncharacterized protein
MSGVWRYVAIGAAAGFFSAFFGVGGGIIAVPLLMIWAAMDVRPAAATSLAAIGITAVAGAANYWSHGDVRPGYAALVGLPAAAGAVAGSALQQRVRSGTIELLFAVVLAGVAVWMLIP